MTVVVGFIGDGCAVMASDSQASEEDRTKHEIDKIWEESGLLLGYSGNTAIRAPISGAISKAIEGFDTGKNRFTVRSKLCGAVAAVLTGEYANYVPRIQPGDQIPPKLAGTLLVVGRDKNGFWLLDIDANAVGTFHSERDFHAIGSGSIGAQTARALLEHYEPQERTLLHLKLIAYRTIETCIRVVAYGVGGEIQLWTCDGDGGFERVTGTDLEDAGHGVEQWTTIEQESLDRVLAQGEEKEVAEPPEAVPEPFAKPDGGSQPEASEPNEDAEEDGS
jgi:20S proteasome alpha/beta subunit